MIKSCLSFPGLLTIAALLLGGCNYDVPLTRNPTRKIDERLLGDWLGGDDGKDLMNVRELDAATYIIAFDSDIYRAIHSDFAGASFVSVESLQLGSEHGKYAYLSWTLSPDGNQLTLRMVSNRIIPETTKGRVALQQLIKANLNNPALFGEPLEFTRKKAP
jgi:hypothetical protein